MFYQFDDKNLQLFAVQDEAARELANFIGTNKFFVLANGTVHVDGNATQEYYIQPLNLRNILTWLSTYANICEELTPIGRTSETREQKFSRMITMIKTGKVERINDKELRISNDFVIKLISGRDGDDVVCVIDGQHHTDMFDEEESSRIHDANNWFIVARRQQEKKDLFMSRGF